MTLSKIVFLVDVDNTLLDNDRIQSDLKRHLEREFGAACRERYWAILEELFTDLGCRKRTRPADWRLSAQKFIRHLPCQQYWTASCWSATDYAIHGTHHFCQGNGRFRGAARLVG